VSDEKSIAELRAELNLKQVAVVDAVLQGKSQQKSYAEVYEVSLESAAPSCSKLLTEPKVKAYMDACKANSLEAVGLTLQKLDRALFDRLEAVLSTNVDDVLEFGTRDGQFGPVSYANFKDGDSMSDAQRRAIKSVQVGQNAKIELHDLGELLKLAYQRHGALTQKNKNENSGSVYLKVDQKDLEV